MGHKTPENIDFIYLFFGFLSYSFGPSLTFSNQSVVLCNGASSSPVVLKQYIC